MTRALSTYDTVAALGWLPLCPLLLAVAAYGLGAAKLHRRGDRWAPTRIAAAAGGLTCLAAATLPPLSTHDEQFPVHVTQHLLLASLAPLLLALSAPVTLALRTVPRRSRRILLQILHGYPARVATAPATVLAVDIGALYALYLTPLFGAAETHPVVHAAVHLHMFVGGCLLSWYLVGIDPMPRRGTIRARLVVLAAASGGHDVLAKLMYAHTLPRAAGTPEQIRAGAQLMFYGGDAIGMLLAVALLAGWYTPHRSCAEAQHLQTAARHTPSDRTTPH